ncbi:hypothetical protein D3C71_2161560 [compost metagenome]
MTRRIAAEGPNTSSNRSVIHKFTFIQMFVDFSHDDIRGFYTYTNINLIVGHCEAAFLEDLG